MRLVGRNTVTSYEKITRSKGTLRWKEKWFIFFFQVLPVFSGISELGWIKGKVTVS